MPLQLVINKLKSAKLSNKVFVVRKGWSGGFVFSTRYLNSACVDSDVEYVNAFFSSKRILEKLEAGYCSPQIMVDGDSRTFYVDEVCEKLVNYIKDATHDSINTLCRSVYGKKYYDIVHDIVDNVSKNNVDTYLKVHQYIATSLIKSEYKSTDLKMIDNVLSALIRTLRETR